MKKHFFVIILGAICLSVFLYFRPKVVVKNEIKANRDNASAEQNTAATESNNEEHASVQLSKEATNQLTELKTQLAKDKKNVQLFEQIAGVFAKENIFDSAAYYFEQAAILSPSLATWSRAGDAYFQAMSLALKPTSIERLTKQTQEMYAKVLAIKPDDLHARTNLAMTYVGSASPMQAISLLRQVLEDAPDYEPALMNMGALSLQSGQNDKAAARFQQVLKKNPSNINAQIGFAYSMIGLKQTRDAKKILEEVLKNDLDPSLRQEVTNTLQSLK